MSDYRIQRVYDRLITDAEAKTIQEEHATWLRVTADTYGDTLKGVTHVWDEITVPAAGVQAIKKRLTSQALIESKQATS